MSTPSLSHLVGLAIAGLCWLPTLGVVEAAPQSPGAAVAASPAKGAAASPVIVLLTDGRLLPGELSEDGTSYLLKQQAGTLRLARKQVEGVFDSIEAIFKYKRDRIAENDPDEHRKLALWCLTHRLNAEARAELEQVLSLNPNDRQARAQMFNLKAAEARRTEGGSRDDAVVQTAGGTSDLAIAHPRRGRPVGSVGPPAIFDLPPVLAVKRYQEFALTVHPELQKRCAGCHHERSNLPFQLVRAVSTRDQLNDLVLRANLDATLALVDRQDPARSPLLVASVLPHRGLNKSILESTNHPTYRALAQWVAGVSSSQPQFEVSPLASGSVSPATGAAPPGGGGFATRRGTATPVEAELPMLAPTPPSQQPPSPGTAQGSQPAPKVRVTSIQTGQVQHPGVPAEMAFPTSPLVGGTGNPPATTPAPTPTHPPHGPATAPGMPPLPTPNPIAGSPSIPVPPGTPGPGGVAPGTTATGRPMTVDPANNPALAPMADPTRPDPKNLYPPEFDKSKAPRKPKIDLNALDTFLRRGQASPPR
jgi:hypothetical protein